MYVLGVAGYVWLAKPDSVIRAAGMGQSDLLFCRLFVNSDMADVLATPCTTTATCAALRLLSVRAISEDVSTEVTR